jgi:hypothetical protein
VSSTQKVHRAADPIGETQRCEDCGELLQDYRGAQSLGDWRPVWWPAGARVCTSRGGRSWWLAAPEEVEAFACTKAGVSN